MKTETITPNDPTTDEPKRITADELAYLRVRMSALNIAAEALRAAQAEYQRRVADKDGFVTYMGTKYDVDRPQIALDTGEIASGD